jgi:hypothetical protein
MIRFKFKLKLLMKLFSIMILIGLTKAKINHSKKILRILWAKYKV